MDDQVLTIMQDAAAAVPFATPVQHWLLLRSLHTSSHDTHVAL